MSSRDKSSTLNSSPSGAPFISFSSSVIEIRRIAFTAAIFFTAYQRVGWSLMEGGGGRRLRLFCSGYARSSPSTLQPRREGPWAPVYDHAFAHLVHFDFAGAGD